ncbi:MAG: hypothetical protein HN348_05025 [Proteobacteria bacterium]|jgi:hypothetical protein|nr:hypothetical protein [Pseudomonadota bacterium]
MPRFVWLCLLLSGCGSSPSYYTSDKADDTDADTDVTDPLPGDDDDDTDFDDTDSLCVEDSYEPNDTIAEAVDLESAFNLAIFDDGDIFRFDVPPQHTANHMS